MHNDPAAEAFGTDFNIKSILCVGGMLVSLLVLISRSSCPGLRLHLVLGQNTLLAVPLSTQVTGELNAGGN